MNKLATTNRSAGFTLIELMVVIILLGIAFTYGLTKIDGLVPSARLDQAARELGDMLTRLRGMAVFSGRTHTIEYDLDGERYRIIRPASIAEKDDGAPDDIITDWFELPNRVSLERVIFSDRDEIRAGEQRVEFTPTGEVVGHLVHLRSDEILDEVRGRFTVELNPITGLVSYEKGEKEYAQLRDEYDFRR